MFGALKFNSSLYVLLKHSTWIFTSVSLGSSPRSYLFTSVTVIITIHTTAKCGTEPIWYVTLYFRDWRGAGVSLTCEQKLYPIWFSCRCSSYPVWREHDLTMSETNLRIFEKNIARWMSWSILWRNTKFASLLGAISDSTCVNYSADFAASCPAKLLLIDLLCYFTEEKGTNLVIKSWRLVLMCSALKMIGKTWENHQEITAKMARKVACRHVKGTKRRKRKIIITATVLIAFWRWSLTFF